MVLWGSSNFKFTLLITRDSPVIELIVKDLEYIFYITQQNLHLYTTKSNTWDSEDESIFSWLAVISLQGHSVILKLCLSLPAMHYCSSITNAWRQVAPNAFTNNGVVKIHETQRQGRMWKFGRFQQSQLCI